MQAHLAAKDLACRRGERILVRGLDLSLSAGEALHIAGPNGVGKSSLIRILAGLLRPFAGTVERHGAIGLLDERPALDPQVPLGRALGFWADMDNIGFLARESCSDRMDLAGLLDVPVRYLSTGQLKRAAFARLIAQQAPIWLLDEPLNGLDAAGMALFEELVDDHRKTGGIAIIASHQPIGSVTAQRLELESLPA